MPLLGNGYCGVALSSAWTFGGESNLVSMGPGGTNALDWFVNLNSMWACEATPPGSVPNVPAVCERASLGGISISVFNASSGSVDLPNIVSVEAEQDIDRGVVLGKLTLEGGGFVNVYGVVDPIKNAFALNVTYDSNNPASEVLVSVSTWVYQGDMDAAASASNDAVVATRRLATWDVPDNVTYQIMQGALASVIDVDSTLPIVQESSNMSYIGGVRNVTLKKGSFFSVLVGVSDNLQEGNGFDPSSSALELLDSTNYSSVADAALKSLNDYYSKSNVTLSSLPEIQCFWKVAQYITKCMTPSKYMLNMQTNGTNKLAVPPSGLYGPWVSMDGPAWHGDYTLDYNQEAQFYHVYSSNHPEIAAGYFPPIVDWQVNAQDGAQDAAKTANISCGASALHYACHLAPWGYQSKDQTTYMHWNGFFAALLFINDFEYTENKKFASTTTLPLLNGLTQWAHCYLTFMNDTDSVLHDYRKYSPDEQHEGQRVIDPQIGLALIRRVSFANKIISEALNIQVPDYVNEILEKLTEFNTATLNGTSDEVWTSFFNATVNDSDNFALYPLWPSEVLNAVDSRTTPNSTKEIALNSIKQYVKFESDRPVLVFSAAVRAGYDPDLIVGGLIDMLDKLQGNNLLPYASGGGVENVGVVQAINDMLLQSSGNCLFLFPVWPEKHPAAFKNLRSKGGFLVSATWDSNKKEVASGVTIESTLGYSRNVTMLDPWFNASSPKTPFVACANPGAPAQVREVNRDIERVVFTIKVHETCVIRQSTGKQ